MEGSPISASTNSGFKIIPDADPPVGLSVWRKTCSENVVSPGRCWFGLPFVEPLADGVRHSHTCSVSISLDLLSPFQSRLAGVAHVFATRPRFCLIDAPELSDRFVLSRCVRVGVGQTEPPLSLVWSANVGRCETEPFRIVPCFGQRPENVVDPHSKDAWDVFQEDESRSHLANDSINVGPEPSIVVESGALADNGDWLARESRSDEIHNATPRSAIEGCEIVPNRSFRQGLAFHPCHEDGRGVSVPFTETHSSIAGDNRRNAKFESGNSGTKSPPIHSTPIKRSMTATI